MTTERDSRERIVLSWLRDDAHENAERVLLRALDEVDATPQRRLPRLARRYSEMTTYAKLATAAAALVVLVGAGVVLNLAGSVGAEASNPPTSSPAAAAPTGANPASPAPGSPATAGTLPGEFTACVPGNFESKQGTDEQIVVSNPAGDMHIERRRGFTWKGAITATDPRFIGTHYYSWDGDGYALPSGEPGPEAWAEGHRIVNADGAWSGSVRGVRLPDGTDEGGGMIILTGEGAYAGLSAVLFGVDGSCDFNFRGIILEVPEPPVPYTGE